MKTYRSADAGHRVCTICGKPGGDGATHVLRLMGYDVPLSNADHPAQAHAHVDCIAKAKRKVKK